MNNKIIALLLLFVFALTVFTACGEKTEDETTETTVAEETETVETSETEAETEKKKTEKKEEQTEAEKTTKKSENKTEEKAEAEETTKKAKKKTEKETEKATEKAEDKILVTYSEKTDDGEYKISLIRTANGEYVLETADGTFPADEGAYKGCLNSFYAFDMQSEKATKGQNYVKILLDDGTYAEAYDSSKDEMGNGFLSIRNILVSFDENAPVKEAPADAAG